LIRGVQVSQLHFLLVVVGHLDGQVFQEPWMVLDLWNGNSLHEEKDEHDRKADAAWHFQDEQFQKKNYLLRITDKYPGQQMSAFH
jgi:hypothetical protein